MLIAVLRHNLNLNVLQFQQLSMFIILLYLLTYIHFAQFFLIKCYFFNYSETLIDINGSINRASGELDPLVTRAVNNKKCLEFLHKHFLPPGLYELLKKSLKQINFCFKLLTDFGWLITIIYSQEPAPLIMWTLVKMPNISWLMLS